MKKKNIIRHIALKNKNLKWTILNPKLVKFDEGKTGKEVEFKAKKIGIATIVCKNTKTDREITFTVKIVRDYDD